MATPLDNAITSQANILAIITELTANPQPSYSVNGVSVSWTDYLAQLRAQAAELQEIIIFLSGPYQLVSQGIS